MKSKSSMYDDWMAGLITQMVALNGQPLVYQLNPHV